MNNQMRMELNPEYARMSVERIGLGAELQADIAQRLDEVM